VLVAGKGHEKYQEVAGRVLPFDDVAVATSALARRRARSRV
jgi:UDP-N-acetylmuramoyl-L-alanyl-D-glutamate--2,6-diaminopimelate ligase